MQREKPSIPQGTRDFLPDQVQRRRWIIQTIQSVFEAFGFLPIETPAVEKLSTLTGKYGEEGDRLIFKILNSGNFTDGVDNQSWQLKDIHKLTPQICEKALRYDLTVPFARFVVMHQHEIVFPFKRYQVQPVWRGDSPQKGRYREFWQCDADIVGSESLIYEVECLQMYFFALQKLGFKDFTIHINHRKLLSAITEKLNIQEKFVDFCVAIDKWDKVGWQGVQKELVERGFQEPHIHALQVFFEPVEDMASHLEHLKKQVADLSSGGQALHDLEKIWQILSQSNPEILSHIKLDLTLARGLNYYTGCIFEVKLGGVVMGSVGGGGRYDNLTALFGKDGLSGIGISFGIDRIYDSMLELNLFQNLPAISPKVYIAYWDETHLPQIFQIATELRKHHIATELSHKNDKIGKQIQLADKKKIPFVLIVGENEIQTGQLTLKNLASGEQTNLTLSQFIDFFTHGKH